MTLVPKAWLVLCAALAQGCLLSFDDYPVGALCDAGAPAKATSDPVLRGCLLKAAGGTTQAKPDARQPAAGAAGSQDQ